MQHLPTPKQETESLQVFGMRMMKTLYARVLYDDAKCVAKGASNRIKELLVNNGRVVGVKVQTQDGKEQEIKADAVILACGGFCNDHSPSDSLLTKYRPELAAYPSTNGTFADGSGIKIALKIGAQKPSDCLKSVCRKTTRGFVDPNDPKYNTKLMCPEALRGFGGILVNKEGRRFANELGLRENFVALIEQHCTVDPISGFKTAYLIMNDAIVDHFGRPAFEIYIKKGLVKKASNMKELCEMAGIPIENLQNTLNDHDRCFRKEKLDAFGKSNFPVQFQTNKNFYFCQTTPCVHYTFGGLKINERCQVLSGTMRPIESLFAAGEIVGGTHGAERLSGNSLLECVVFGRLAAVEAMKGGRLQYRQLNSSSRNPNVTKGKFSIKFHDVEATKFLTGIRLTIC
uniref:FAD-dependent oxidoreductase 2 FAD binding domain-containing protein n=1 Tax=Romanomermis culicivorax TaxID=13658 RepID=A0A915J3H6_ROMCU